MLESQQQTVEALKQRVVKFPGDSPVHSAARRVERRLERVLHLTYAVLIRWPTAAPATEPRPRRETSWSYTRAA